jgi:hypothetical protein
LGAFSGEKRLGLQPGRMCGILFHGEPCTSASAQRLAGLLIDGI